MKKYLSYVLITVLSVMILTACSGETPLDTIKRVDDIRNLNDFSYSLMNLTGTDALGRKVEIKDTAKDKISYVGLFYSVWLGQHQEAQSGIWNIQYLLDTNPEALYQNDSEISPSGDFHFWGEPLYGYYNMKDPWVVSRHIELLTMAGIDYLCFDATNAKVYKDATDNVLDTLLEYQQQGFNVPKIVFYTNSNSGTTVDIIYYNYYQTEKYQSLWFQPNGKPLIIGITENNAKASDQTKYSVYTDFIKAEMKEFFEVKESQWPNGNYNENAIPWMSWQYPQWNHNGNVSVPVAQHSHSKISASCMHPESSRGYNNLSARIDSDWREGKSFQTMWDTVHQNEDTVNNVLVTGFNEWMAIKYNNSEGVYFVDVFNHEYSRDIEMMKDGYGDNYMLQLIQNVRKYKYTEAKHYKYQKMTIDISNDTSFAQWGYVKAAYKDFAGDALARDFINAAGTARYTDSSNRNDITDIKVVHDSRNLYFYIQTLQDITAYNGTDLNWMNVLIKAGESINSFSGYQYIIGRNPNSDGFTAIEKSTGGYQWNSAGQASYSVKGNVMQIAIPLSSLGLTADNCSIEFKVADNVTKYSDIMDYYVTGDSAPIGRLSYSYGY